MEAGKREARTVLENDEARKKTHYARLFRRFILLTLICSLLPLLLVGWAINIHYTGFARSRMITTFQTQVEYHRKIIELFLRERSAQLQLIAQTHSRDYLGKMANLAVVFEMMNQEYGSIADLGIIGENGRHLAYIGPYDLMDRDYSEAPWFKKVRERGLYISDMFLGFRKVPHFIIAIARNENGEKWVLRATIDTEVFRSLVENVRIGQTGEVYLLNREGVFQTSPRFTGKIMERVSFPVGPHHEGIRIHMQEPGSQGSKQGSARQIMATAWLREPQWMLVVKQEYAEAFNEVNHANYATLIFLHLSAVTILIVSILSTRHMIGLIRRRDREADQLNQQLMQASKLASIGELSAGVAHEINNPLAIILTERQILMDLIEQHPDLIPEFRNQLEDSLQQIDSQINRCKRITYNLLRFARRTKSVIEPVDLNSFLREVIELMEREARSSGIKFFTDFQKDLPSVLSDPSQLQQVFLNLITNAIDAHDGKPYGTIRVTTSAEEQNKFVHVTLADTGSGIAKGNLEKIFDPFFTTKAVGKGTGLGLAICYSIIKRLGGDIRVESEEGAGTRFLLSLPCNPPPEVLEDMQESLAG
ncbi:MAG: GHKL domain-containing protein [Deltaproteobacteria bacterium]|nr:GHKL domain-containing protein [Deltaproteobacteria bacterium]